eukprot:CAMPEP_0202904590 /NCGR_PEP_ID=MMETSP1392-20130828/30196_1 /ASSEMBLY_ACC=CAM_ASM_000868 /TAXON_ID=225041 /ORGANISM="Chlamydomonas chlamydogama, Strain SAG 11-48b" /LENGTH=86 /DNA_ID=CAMNT_0049592293 /DNA_START=30 /DNA_END=290 /DNA_ORIENTATION=+
MELATGTRRSRLRSYLSRKHTWYQPTQTLLNFPSPSQEAQAASDVVAGTGHEVNAWSCTVAHMLHTYDLLMRARAMRAEGMSRGAV